MPIALTFPGAAGPILAQLPPWLTDNRRRLAGFLAGSEAQFIADLRAHARRHRLPNWL